MVFREDIIKDICNKLCLLFDRAGDFESLSSKVYKETGRTIGITTLYNTPYNSDKKIISNKK